MAGATCPARAMTKATPCPMWGTIVAGMAETNGTRFMDTPRKRGAAALLIEVNEDPLVEGYKEKGIK
uniref:Uncharacterized protein n=1 Tax=Romanomermis culicivorax TaxID=13658 RepID=A0A915HGF3_ROMCU